MSKCLLKEKVAKRALLRRALHGASHKVQTFENTSVRAAESAQRHYVW